MANIYNIDELDYWLDTLMTESSNVDAWIETTLRKFMINEYEGRSLILQLPDDVDSFVQLDIVAQKLYKIYFDDELHNFCKDIKIAIEFLKTFPASKKLHINVLEAIRQGFILHGRQCHKAKDITQTLFNIGNYRLIECLNVPSVQREGNIMGNCLRHAEDSCVKAFEKKSSRIFSLKDSKNMSRCTIEYHCESRTIVQVQGKFNQPITKSLLPIIKETIHLLLTKGIAQYVKNNILISNRLLIQDSQYYDIDDLPINFKVKDELCLSQIEGKVKLPNNLTILGNLILSNCDIDKLPSNLTIYGNLNISNTNILELPENLFVQGNLYAYSTKIKVLSKECVSGSVYSEAMII